MKVSIWGSNGARSSCMRRRLSSNGAHGQAVRDGSAVYPIDQKRLLGTS